MLLLFVNVAATSHSIFLAIQATLLPLTAREATARTVFASGLNSEWLQHRHRHRIRIERGWTVEGREGIHICRLCCAVLRYAFV